MARRAEIVVVLHVVPRSLAAERGASDDDGNDKGQRPPKASWPRSQPSQDCVPPAPDEHENPRRHGNAQKESANLDPLRDIEKEPKDARDGIGQRRRRNESSQRISWGRVC
jgi:hypothetical protein